MSKLTDMINKFGWFPTNYQNFKGVENLLTFFVIILPKWSPKDISLIEWQANYIQSFGCDVYVFEIDDFHSMAQIQELFPGFPKISITPVVGLYKNGKLKNCVVGYKKVQDLHLLLE